MKIEVIEKKEIILNEKQLKKVFPYDLSGLTIIDIWFEKKTKTIHLYVGGK